MAASGAWTNVDKEALLLAALQVHQTLDPTATHWPGDASQVWADLGRSCGKTPKHCRNYMHNNFKRAWDSQDDTLLAAHHIIAASVVTDEHLPDPRPGVAAPRAPASEFTAGSFFAAVALALSLLVAFFQRLVGSARAPPEQEYVAMDTEEPADQDPLREAARRLGIKLYGSEGGADIKLKILSWTPALYVYVLDTLLADETDPDAVFLRSLPVYSTRGTLATESRIRFERLVHVHVHVAMSEMRAGWVAT